MRQSLDLNMDGSRFDDLTRVFGASRSRRHALKLAAVSVLALAAGRRRTDIASAAICPNRVPNPDHVPSSNGCGTASFPVSGQIGKVDVTPACNNHDRCYDTCNKAKDDCDTAFKNELQAICAAGNPNGSKALTDCVQTADVYYRAVAAFGDQPYEAAQNSACICCRPAETVCGGRCLPACPNGFARDADCACVCSGCPRRCAGPAR